MHTFAKVTSLFVSMHFLRIRNTDPDSMHRIVTLKEGYLCFIQTTKSQDRS